MGKTKYYVVWEGRIPGVYDDYSDVQEQVDGYSGAKFKGFATSQEATEAYRRGTPDNEEQSLGSLLAGASVRRTEEKKVKKTKAAYPRGTAPSYSKTVGNKRTANPSTTDWHDFPEIDTTAWAVDASCLGNPGRMDYRGVDLASGEEIFKVGPFEDATNNIGEFLAIVHACALMEQRGETHAIYSDSVSGMAWVRNRKINTQLKETGRNKKVFELMARALAWLYKHRTLPKVMKWQTELWGEIPADFGRK